MTTDKKETLKQNEFWYYIPSIVDVKQAKIDYKLFSNVIQQTVKEHGQPKVIIFGKEFEQKRNVVCFAKKEHDYTYSGAKQKIHKWISDFDYYANRASDLVFEYFGVRVFFDTILANFYPNGDSYIGPHRDKDAMNNYIVSFSLYANNDYCRDFNIKYDPLPAHKNDKKPEFLGAITNKIPLEQGSVLIMCPGMQQLFVHTLPKRKNCNFGRVNFTLRSHSTV